MKRILGRLLHLANAGNSGRDFYAMKSRLLERWGTPDGFDVQHINGKKCFACDGDGYCHWHSDCREGYCHKCGGTGWWRNPVWVTLQRYTLGRYTFHIPRERIYLKPDPDVTNINGYIEHKSYGRKSQAALLWLALAFDRRLFWREMTCSRPCGWQWRPLMALNVLLFEMRMKASDYRTRCHECGRHTWKSCCWQCKRCEKAALKRCEQLEKVPF